MSYFLFTGKNFKASTTKSNFRHIHKQNNFVFQRMRMEVNSKWPLKNKLNYVFPRAVVEYNTIHEARSNLLDSTPHKKRFYNTVYIFFFFYLCARTIIAKRTRNWVVNSSSVIKLLTFLLKKNLFRSFNIKRNLFDIFSKLQIPFYSYI